MSNDRKGFASFSLYKDMRPLVEALPADPMLKAIYRFVCNGAEPEPFGDQISELTWRMFKEKLQNSKNHEEEISKVRAEAGRAGGIAKATNSQQMLANRSKAPTYTYTDTDTVTGPVHSTGTGTVTVTDTDTETDTENREGSQGPDVPDAAAAAADAAPPAPASALSPVPAEEDLFSRERLEKIAERNRIPVTADGVATFYDEMHENGWILYGKRVTRTGITRAFRGWLKYHSEFRSDGVPDEQPAEKRGTDQEGKAQAEEKTTFNSRAELLAIDGLRDQMVSSICEKLNAWTGKNFSWESQSGLSQLVEFIRNEKRIVLSRISRLNHDEKKAIGYLWDIWTEDEEDEG